MAMKGKVHARGCLKLKKGSPGQKPGALRDMNEFAANCEVRLQVE